MMCIPRAIMTIAKFPKLLNVRQPGIGFSCFFDQYLPYFGRDGFEVNLNCKRFRPNEISVKVVKDIETKIEDKIIIEGKHKEIKNNNNYISREFFQEYNIPSGYDIEKITSILSADGILQIKVPAQKNLSQNQNERTINISFDPSKIN